MKLSFTTMATPQLSGIEAIKLARKYGYDGVDLRISECMGELNLNSTLDEINQVKNCFALEGIKPSGLLCYNETGTDEPASWQRMTESILRHIEIAARLESPTIRIFCGNPYQSINPEDYLNRTADSITQALQKSENKVAVLIQNHEGGFSVTDAIKLAAQIDHSRFGLVFSPDHCMIMEEALPDIYTLAKPFAKQIYVADILMKANKPIPVFPGKGCVPIDAVYTAFGGSDYEGWITFKWEKIWHAELEEPEIALPNFIEYFNWIKGGVDDA